MEKTIQIIEAISKYYESFVNLRWIDKVTATGVLFTVFGVILTIYKVIQGQKIQNKMLIESQKQKERENISHKLNFFFGPLKELGSESIILYEHFAKKEKDEADKKNKKRFRTLRHLSQGKFFKPQDIAILEQIIEIIKKQLILIEKEGQIIENSQLAILLGKFGAHVRLLSLATEHRLDGMHKNLEKIVFPKELNGAIETEIRKLQDRYKELDPSFKIEKPGKLDKEQKKIISYYNKNDQEYYRKTAQMDLKHLYTLFLKRIPFGGFVLDAGCGVGRDTRYFIEKGRIVISFDASIQMVNLCMQYPFAYCMHKSFSDIDFIEEFDGVWACASLIHLSKNKFVDALYRLSRSLKPNGIFFFSLKRLNNKSSNQNKPKAYFYNEYIINLIMIKELGFERIETEQIAKTDNSEFKPYLFRKPS